MYSTLINDIIGNKALPEILKAKEFISSCSKTQDASLGEYTIERVDSSLYSLIKCLRAGSVFIRSVSFSTRLNTSCLIPL